MTRYNAAKSLLNGAVLAIILGGTAVAQDAPVLQGNFSANIERANPVTGPAMPAANVVVSTGTKTYGFPRPVQDRRPMGNYSSNITLFDLHGR